MALISFAEALPNKVHTITLFSASMAYLTAQKLNTRYIVKSGKMMSHRAYVGGLSGQVPGEANKRLKHIGSMVRKLSKDVSKRVGISYQKYLKSIYDELWLTAEQAVEQNHADAIAIVKCDESLEGTTERLVRTIFGAINVTFSRCPLITGPIAIASSNQKVRSIIKKKLNFTSRKYFGFYL
jgi:hypothetical protein